MRQPFPPAPDPEALAKGPAVPVVLVLALALALAAGLLAAYLAFPSGLRAGISLSLPAALDEGDPEAETLAGWARDFSRRAGWNAEPEFLGHGAVAGVRTLLADPDGLTAGFLSLDETVTRALQDLAPYDASEFLPAVVFPSGAPVLVSRGDGPEVNLAALKASPGSSVSLMAPSLTPVPGPTLIALDVLRRLDAKVEIRELPDMSRKVAFVPEGMTEREVLWGRAYVQLKPGELLALSYDALEAVRSQGADPRIELVLAFAGECAFGDDADAADGVTDGAADGGGDGSATPPVLAIVPEGPRLCDLGVSPGIRELYGFYYPSDTGERAQEGAPALIAAIVGAALAGPQDTPFVTGPALTGDEAQEAFDSETLARGELLEAYSLAGGDR
ncbi:MAG: hypothetical protein LBR80_06365 [Deltaproteobacteria bacterium]|jgi:hypothetical protein|nr:hypothetical protein [Deltaproteobacteria bacterium]